MTKPVHLPLALLVGFLALAVGVLCAFLPIVAVGLVVAVTVLWGIFRAPLPALVIVGLVLCSGVYIDSAFNGLNVDEGPVGGRIVRDGVLVLFALLVVSRKSSGQVSRYGLVILAIWAVGMLWWAPRDETLLRNIRYLAIVPLVGWGIVDRLTAVMGPRATLRLVARVTLVIATFSAAVGIPQSLGAFGDSFYTGYVPGFNRGVGIVGQPNNQAFLVLVGVVALRAAEIPSRRWRAVLAGVLVVGILATFSRAGLIGLVILTVISGGLDAHWTPGRVRLLTRGILLAVLIAVGLSVVQLRTGDFASSVSGDGRVELAENAAEGLQGDDWWVGNPYVKNRIRLTDNAYVDLVLLGGIPLLLGFLAFTVRLWTRATVNASLNRALLAIFALNAGTTSVFGLFPGILFMWALLFAFGAGVVGPRPQPSKELMPPALAAA